ncbi:DUF952 domain-containing protein [Paracoccus sp. (in: a-proteobacteria)]|uniref:DUF952 domain-containing protein n=1 Tax=Paracoccus sp. TaxID=267 RepID=UPI0026DFF5D6|nr:DUF952 domain-containing protein [Paracoccus sp. (in: a-proteobacteria)]MDO5647996.1 DUF952 domain-containing protein [Paracoccus sp. (in: a-proteobacteria)]
MLIYKILRPAEWAHLQEQGATDGAPVDVADGFVHFSTAAQLPVTLSKHFAGDGDVILLACEADGMEALQWEPSRGGDLFPHLYRALRMDDVLWARDVPRTENGHDIKELE